MAAEQPDYATLYAELGLPPDCTLAQFKRACRQRIAELHPDKAAPGASAPAALPIAELLSLYDSALRFHRRHGRLPGAPARIRPPPAPDSGDAAAQSTPRPAHPAAARWRLWAAGGATLALLLALFAAIEPQPAPPRALPAPATPPDATAEQAGDAAPAPALLELGMDAETVLAIEGEPLQRDDRDWFYGPSWLRFEKGRLVDWYSSPLRRLRTATPTPPADAVPTEQPP